MLIETDLSVQPSTPTTEQQPKQPQELTQPATSPTKCPRFSSIALSSHLHKIKISIDASLTSLIIAQTKTLFQQETMDGLDHRNHPSGYVEEMYQTEIISQAKNYLFYHIVIDFLINEFFARKIAMSNYPRLTSIELQDDNQINYFFDVSIADDIELKEWKHFSFKSPKRKKYKDLDKQVISFIEGKQTHSPKKNTPSIIEESDWVLFDAEFVDSQSKSISQYFKSSFWLHVDQQEISEPFVYQLLGKEIGASFYTRNLNVTDGETKDEQYNYPFLITVKALVKGAYFSVENFKSTFKLKNKNDIHNKLMEVFSYRNDISQRKAIIEEVFHLLLSKHRFEVPKHLVLRREEDIVKTLCKQPDYHVYKAQEDFGKSIELLAEKQLKEEIIIDQLAYQENLRAEQKDFAGYLHLLCDRRLKEFVYFKPVLLKIDEQRNPINVAILSQAVLREKTLNHVIYTLTR